MSLSVSVEKSVICLDTLNDADELEEFESVMRLEEEARKIEKVIFLLNVLQKDNSNNKTGFREIR